MKKSNLRLKIFISIFTLLNLIFVPLLSLYGLRVCSVLSIPGFGFGCYYSAAYVGLVNLLNFSLLLILKKEFGEEKTWLTWLRVHRLASYAITYLIATLGSLVLLQFLLQMNHLSSHSRAPEILAFASILLGTLQAYGLNWALNDENRSPKNRALPGFQRLWLNHVFRTMLPVITVSGILLHFLISHSFDFNEGHTAPTVSNEKMIQQTAYVVMFLLCWLVITFTFHFLSERDQVKRVQTHFNHLQELDLKYRSNSDQAWGLWAAILDQLNSFSKTLGERSRLLKTFSKFVTASVAEQAVHEELNESGGETRELTVMMSDIRNFTAISEKLSPQQVVVLLNEYFSTMLDILSSHQVSVDKFIGDGILAYVDLDTSQNSTAASENSLAVDAALTMVKSLTQLNLKLQLLGLPEIKIGVGIYRGPLVIGLIGSASKLQHTIIGDTVNRTARLEGFCKELQVPIVISGLVWHSLSESRKTNFKSFGKKSIAGIQEPMELFGGPFTHHAS
jgi:class 3 adenylate cyclase